MGHPCVVSGPAPQAPQGPRDALEEKGRLGRRLEEVDEAVGGGYCRLQMRLTLALGARETVAGRRLGALGGKGGPLAPPPPPPRSEAGPQAGAVGFGIDVLGPESCEEGGGRVLMYVQETPCVKSVHGGVYIVLLCPPSLSNAPEAPA